MKSILRATFVLSLSSGITIVIGIITTKILAIILGPKGFGYYGLIQNLISICIAIGAMGIGAGIVRYGAKSITIKNLIEIYWIRKAGFILTLILGIITSGILFSFRKDITSTMLGGLSNNAEILLISIVILFTMLSNIQNSILNSYHYVNVLALVKIIDTIIIAFINVMIIWYLNIKGIMIALALGSVCSFINTRIFLKIKIKINKVKKDRRDFFIAIKKLLFFGCPYTGSILVGSGVQYILPILVLQELGTESVGYYRAALSISIKYLSFLIASMSQDYFPRISAEANNPKSLVNIVNEQNRTLMLLSIPIILCFLSLINYIVPILFTKDFYPTTKILEWHLIGDLFKLSSWTMSYVILVNCKAYTYFITESVAGISLLSISWLGLKIFGLEGLGIGFLISYIIYYLVVFFVVRKKIHFSWSLFNLKLFFVGFACTLFIRFLSYTYFHSYKTEISLIITLAFIIFSGKTLYKDYKNEK